MFYEYIRFLISNHFRAGIGPLDILSTWQINVTLMNLDLTEMKILEESNEY